jgi:hypothetical protein
MYPDVWTKQIKNEARHGLLNAASSQYRLANLGSLALKPG